ncbi:unnamed protein product [Arctia plantaginis]|uniref:LITAF domain-containing protein n=1 Tax=Arctia plantaginis TaxID=874455 RepID=A0A8S1A1Y7_ARCPL|nr:unnamed protein product [Arctia plantaginis]
MVIKQNGTVTYIFAILLCVLFMPLVFFVFCSDCLKEKTHYCPNCNKRIGFEVPVVGSNIHFEKPSNSSY